MARAFLFVLDPFGVGHSADAQAFGDHGANTFGHLRDESKAGRGDREGLRHGPLGLPVVKSPGLWSAAGVAGGMAAAGLVAGGGGSVGLRPGYADTGETIAAHPGLARGLHGASFLENVDLRA